MNKKKARSSVQWASLCGTQSVLAPVYLLLTTTFYLPFSGKCYSVQVLYKGLKELSD